MRKIKFRGLCKNGDRGINHMVYGDLLQFANSASIINETGSFQVSPKTVGQFTGLLDRKGKEIYEGDIFKSTQYPFTIDGEENYVGVVVFDNDQGKCGWCYEMKSISQKSRERNGTQPLSMIRICDIEVCDNIHQLHNF